MRDRLCEWVASWLPRRVVSYCVLRVINEVTPKCTLDQFLEGDFVHPDEIGWFEALGKFDPRGPQKPNLYLVK